MVTNETIETINYIKDIEIEYNIKIILLVLIFAYSVFFAWFSFKWETEYIWQDIIKVYLFRLPALVCLFFFPLMVFYLFRAISWEVIYTLLIAAFSYVVVIMGISLQAGLWIYFAEAVGVEMKTKKMEMKEK